MSAKKNHNILRVLFRWGELRTRIKITLHVELWSIFRLQTKQQDTTDTHRISVWVNKEWKICSNCKQTFFSQQKLLCTQHDAISSKFLIFFYTRIHIAIPRNLNRFGIDIANIITTYTHKTHKKGNKDREFSPNFIVFVVV